MSAKIYPTITLKLDLPKINFSSDDEKARFQHAVEDAISFYRAVVNPEKNRDFIFEFGQSILRSYDFDPLIWSEHLWGAVASSGLQRCGQALGTPGHA